MTLLGRSAERPVPVCPGTAASRKRGVAPYERDRNEDPRRSAAISIKRLNYLGNCCRFAAIPASFRVRQEHGVVGQPGRLLTRPAHRRIVAAAPRAGRSAGVSAELMSGFAAPDRPDDLDIPL